MPSNRVVFLDRDGVINRDSRNYIKSWDEFDFLPGTLEALARLAAGGFTVFLVTNQSAVGRGMITLGTLLEIHARMVQAVEAAGGAVRDVFFCPHRPDEGCACRKPLPGMIRQAQARYGIDPATAVMVGDSAKDVQCGRAAGCARTALVATGNGRAARRELEETGTPPDFFGPDLDAVSRWLTGDSRPRPAIR